MKKVSKALMAISLPVLLAIACSKSGSSPDPGGNPNPNPPGGGTCNTANMKFSSDIVPILNVCQSCHSGATISGGVNLSNYAGVKAVVDNGKLVAAIKHQSGVSPMPQNAPKLSDCNISKIEAWIQQGAQNN